MAPVAREIELPPVMRIAADEQLWRFSAPSDLARHMRSRGLVSELRRQSEWTLSEFPYVGDVEPSPAVDHAFVVAPSGSLIPSRPLPSATAPAVVCAPQSSSRSGLAR